MIETQLLSSHRVDPRLLARRTDPAVLTGILDAPTLPGTRPSLVGHQRAARSIDYAFNVALPGYNLFVMGPSGIGKSRFVREAIVQRSKPARPRDWVYLHNFKTPDKPIACALEAGDGERLRKALQTLVAELKATLPAAFEAESYQTEVERLQAELSARQSEALQAISDEATASHIALVQTPNGLSLAPAQDGEVMEPEAFKALADDAQKQLLERIAELEEKLQRVVRDGVRLRRQQVASLRELNRQTAMFATEQAIEDLRKAFAAYAELTPWFADLEQDVLEHFDRFLPEPAREDDNPLHLHDDLLGLYDVNVLTASRTEEGQVVVVDHPTVAELVGRVDLRAAFGTMSTDFRLIKPGALHLANGGYLMVDAWRLFSEPHAWDTLKRALQRRAIRIESLAEAAGMAGVAHLEPAPIPLDVKVVLFGERFVYSLLAEHDPDFETLFRVVADFDDVLPRDAVHERGLARVIVEQAAANGLAPLELPALARLLDEAVRLAEDSTRFSSHVQTLVELAVEADYQARRGDCATISIEHIREAIAHRRDRVSRAHREHQRAIDRGTLLIDTCGQREGQVNALAVYDIAGQGFGHPSKITATVRVGEGTLLDIQRETHLGGALHSKGVMILSAYLGVRYASRQPLPINATLVFEQSYGPIDGDSATVAELCALVSALAGIAVRQDIAITGSMNQVGEVQAVGGLNDKIEGFFEICSARGLTGTQGVIIPASNVEHLMLSEVVVDAVTDGRFHVWGVERVDQAIEMLMGTPAGSDTDGPQLQSIASRIQQRITDFQLRRSGNRAAARRARLTGVERDL